MNKSIDDIVQKVRADRKPLQITKASQGANLPVKKVSQSISRRRTIRRKRRSNTFPFPHRASLRNNTRLRNRRKFGNKARSAKTMRLFVTNLNENLTNADLKAIFETVGPLKRCGIRWTELGQSKGTADVEYTNSSDAYRAKELFHNHTIGGVPIRIELREESQKRMDNGTRRRKFEFKRRRRFPKFRK